MLTDGHSQIKYHLLEALQSKTVKLPVLQQATFLLASSTGPSVFATCKLSMKAAQHLTEAEVATCNVVATQLKLAEAPID